ncbi:hypothetical protein BDP27DRAFT_1429138 [Rhodocollybia butyracea]|uniref:Uncharacterized protein n=1 Tax=Rhodocollybia butyracea TaxID=206335 RepID=A0A9P5PCC2_9AGAR|nr:hypothetical protein BDP27DRAFT_1429138 [Rhodocollybia butyracea]
MPSMKRVREGKDGRGEEKIQTSSYGSNSVVPTHRQASPLPFALDKMRIYEFVELWYFVLEGCEEARLNSLAESTTGYGFAAIGNDPTTTALWPLSTLTKSQKAIPDKQLSFSHLSIAKTLYILTMMEVGWQVKVQAWAQFYMILENHHFR